MPHDSDEIRREKNLSAVRRYQARNKALIQARRKQWLANPENKAKALAAGRKWLAKPGNRAKKADAKRKLRSQKPADYNRNRYLREKEAKYLLAGKPRPEACEVCGRTKVRICFDHDHQRGHFRGWICDRCNRVLGAVKDDIRVLLKLIAYLQRTQVNTSPQLSLPGV